MTNHLLEGTNMNNSNVVPAGASPVLFTGSVPSVFSNEEFGSVRVITKEDGEPLFCGKDVATCLGYADPSNAVSVRVDEEDKTTLVIYQCDLSERTSKTTFINESGLYSLILGSKLESAKKFKRWVTSEILPSIRKTGSYSVQQQYQIPQSYVEALEALVASEKEKLLLQDKNDEQKHIIKQQRDVIDVLAPKAIAFEDESSTGGWYSGSEAAKLIYGRAFKDGRTKLYEFLREKGILLRVGKNNMPSGHYMDNGWLKTVWTSDVRTGYEIPTPVFSKKGIKGIHEMLIDEELKAYKEPLFVGSI